MPPGWMPGAVAPSATPLHDGQDFINVSNYFNSTVLSKCTMHEFIMASSDFVVVIIQRN